MSLTPEQRAKAVKLFLEDATIRGVFEGIRAEYLRRIEDSKPHDRDAREAAYARLQALQDLRVALQSVVDDGTMAARRAPSR